VSLCTHAAATDRRLHLGPRTWSVIEGDQSRRWYSAAGNIKYVKGSGRWTAQTLYAAVLAVNISLPGVVDVTCYRQPSTIL